MGAAEELLASALAATAQRMEELAQAVPSERLGETKHLTPALRAEVEALLRASGSRGDAGARPLELVDW